jgi:3-deoxy-7-phosphoheptulonate synthase
LAGIAAGADGVILEVHPEPDQAMSDGAQSLNFEQVARLSPKIAAVAEVVGRELTIPTASSL